jgi:DNA-binding Lrp family transcriptional regulator
MGRRKHATAGGAARRAMAAARSGLDDLDWRLLGHLQNDARVSTAELARQFKLSPPGVQKRLRRLEEKGVIQRYVTVVNREAVGLDLLCFVLVMLAHHRADSVQRFRAGIAAMPEVLECHYLTGEFDCLLKLVAANHEELQRFLERLMKVGGVDRLRTSIVLNEIKSVTALPLEAPARHA